MIISYKARAFLVNLLINMYDVQTINNVNFIKNITTKMYIGAGIKCEQDYTSVSHPLSHMYIS